LAMPIPKREVIEARPRRPIRRDDAGGPWQNRMKWRNGNDGRVAGGDLCEIFI
jgi:hypothetical protein